MFRGIFSVLAGEALVLAALAAVAADLGAHKRVENLGGLNIRGYRGPVAHQRQPNELRIVFAGGTRAFGWGEPPSSTTVAAVRFELTRVLDRPNKPLMPIVAINLGQLGAPPESYARTLEHFAYLRPDYIGIFDDLGATGPNRPFEPSGVFTLTGYQPMLPLVLEEKGAVTKTRTVGASLEYAGRMLAALDCALARVAGGVRDASPASAASVEAYAEAMTAAIDVAHRQARGVVVVLAPIDSDRQRHSREALATRLKARNAAPWLRVVDLSDQADLYDPPLRLDGFSFGAAGSSTAAEAIAPAFLDLIPSR
jgi:hypothetical protein